MRITHMNSKISNTNIQGLDPLLHSSLISALNRQTGTSSRSDKSPETAPEDTSDCFVKAFVSKLIDVDRKFSCGTIPYIKQAYPELYYEINEVEAGLNIIWKKTSKGFIFWKDCTNVWQRLTRLLKPLKTPRTGKTRKRIQLKNLSLPKFKLTLFQR